MTTPGAIAIVIGQNVAPDRRRTSGQSRDKVARARRLVPHSFGAAEAMSCRSRSVSSEADWWGRVLLGEAALSKKRSPDPASQVRSAWRELWVVTANSGIPDVLVALQRYHAATIRLAAAGHRQRTTNGDATLPWRIFDRHGEYRLEDDTAP